MALPEPRYYTADGTMADIGTLSGYESSIGWAINASGQVAGWAYSNSSGPAVEEAFIYSDGVMTVAKPVRSTPPGRWWDCSRDRW